MVDKPVMQHVVEEDLEPSDVDGAVIVSSHTKPQIEQYFASLPAPEADLLKAGKEREAAAVRESGEMHVSFVCQDDALGLGHTVLCAKNEIDGEPILVLLGDYLVPDRRMCVRMEEVSREHGGRSVIAVAPAPHDQVSRYGIVAGGVVASPDGTVRGEEEPGAVLKLSGLVEKPAPLRMPA